MIATADAPDQRTAVTGPSDRGLEAARTALHEQVGADVVGEHLGASVEPAIGDALVVTHQFASALPGYRGWHWAVTVVAAPGQDRVTLDEVVLLPGEGAVVAPQWVPWRERIKPGDLSPGDLLPTDEDDPRLVPGWFAGDPEDETTAEIDNPADRRALRLVAEEVGLGRGRVLSVEGRDQAAQRWYAGAAGPQAPIAQSAPGRCGNCGFLVRLAGPLAEMFGVCANAFANDDGRVVSYDHGCGAHSEAQLRRKQLPQPLPDPVFDSITLDDLEDF